MRDVSYGGCRLTFDRAAVIVGSTVNLDIGMSRVPGQVMWTSGCDAGVRFQRPLAGEAAVCAGLEQPAPPTTVDAVIAEITPVAGLRHWIRRVFGFEFAAAQAPR